MFVEILQNEQLAALREAFNRACAELGLGMSAEDTARRKHLAVFMLTAAKAGERDPSVILVKAIQQMPLVERDERQTQGNPVSDPADVHMGPRWTARRDSQEV